MKSIGLVLNAIMTAIALSIVYIMVYGAPDISYVNSLIYYTVDNGKENIIMGLWVIAMGVMALRVSVDYTIDFHSLAKWILVIISAVAVVVTLGFIGLLVLFVLNKLYMRFHVVNNELQ